jgi:MYXO-CTERM domain-containing protein
MGVKCAVLYATGVRAGPDDAPRITALVGALAVAAVFGWVGIRTLTQK